MKRSSKKALCFALQLAVILVLLYGTLLKFTREETIPFRQDSKLLKGPILPGFSHENSRHCIQKERRQMIQKVCDSQRMPDTVRPDLYPYGRILVDQEHKIAYCGIPKVGTSTYMGLLINASTWYQTNSSIQALLAKDPGKAHSPDILHKAGVKKLLEFNKTSIHHILQSHTKFLVVRHPMERLASAYLDKMVKEDNAEYRMKQQKVMEKYVGEKGESQGGVVPFEAFADMLLNVDDGMATHNEHWMEYVNLCHPCYIKYDYVVQMETVELDMPYIMERLFKNSKRTSVSKINSLPKSKHRKLELFEKLDQTVVDGLASRYDIDMKMFGYAWNSSFIVKTPDC